MKYLLCYVTRPELESLTPDNRIAIIKAQTYTVIKEEFESFTDAIEQYTLKCYFCPQVTLSKTWGNEGVEGEIIRQYSCYRDHIFIG